MNIDLSDDEIRTIYSALEWAQMTQSPKTLTRLANGDVHVIDVLDLFTDARREMEERNGAAP